MNIVMIGPFGPGAQDTSRLRALPMAQALAGRGHSVTLMAPPWDDPADVGRTLETAGLRVAHVALPPKLPLLYDAWLALRLVRQALALRPDVIHCIRPNTNSGLACSLLGWLRPRLHSGPRLVVDVDENATRYAPGQEPGFTWHERWGLARADAVVAASRGFAHLIEEMGVPPDRILYVPSGVLPPADPAGPGSVPAEAGEPAGTGQVVRMLWELEDAAIVLLYADFNTFRLERIVEIVRRAVAQVPHLKLLVLGEGPLGEESELDELLTEARLSEYAVFTGWVETERLPGYFAAADAAIFPCDDTLLNRIRHPVKLVDLLAAGLPVVADAVGQNAEYIADGDSGLLVPAEDDAALAGAVVHLLQDAGLRARLGRAAARRVQQQLAWSKLADQVERAYR
jgi:glycosyltransferase involved in cell wall biosynthesis